MMPPQSSRGTARPVLPDRPPSGFAISPAMRGSHPPWPATEPGAPRQVGGHYGRLALQSCRFDDHGGISNAPPGRRFTAANR